MFEPRFVAVAWFPRHGSRDEVIFSEGYEIATAETRGWLDHLVNKYFGEDSGEDTQLRVHDNAPRSEWSVEISEKKRRESEEQDDLPF